MTRIHTSMFLLGLCVVGFIVAWLRLLTEQPSRPPGSSYSTQLDGAQALYEWTASLGQSPQRLGSLSARAAPSLLFVLQPETPPSDKDFSTVLSHGGTLVLAGDSVPTFIFARTLGVTFEPAQSTSLRTPDGAVVLPVRSSFRLSAANAAPLLLGSNADLVAARIPYEQGNVVVIATSDLLSNAALRDDTTAGFVFRELLGNGAQTTSVAFDEAHHSFAPPNSSEATLDQLLFSSAAGRAILYAGLLTFAFIVLTGRRLGPPVAPHPASERRRTMYEHVQMLASLYRRAGQLAAARSTFLSHYMRANKPPDVVVRIERAHSEADLIAAVAAADDAR